MRPFHVGEIPSLGIAGKQNLPNRPGLSQNYPNPFSTSTTIEYYVPEHHGVIIQTANARKDIGEGFAPVTEKPLGEGSIVRVLSIDNNWYKVRIDKGIKGYVKKEYLKLIF